MRLPPDQAKHFIDLYIGLIGWCTRRRDPNSTIYDADSYCAASVEDDIEARDRMLDEPEWIDEYTAENPDDLSPEDLEAVSEWRRRFIRGKLVIERDLKRHTIFLDWTELPKAYAVLSLMEDIVEVLPMPLPVLVEAVLLPWRGVIVCDGLLRFSSVFLGPGIRRSLKESYRIARADGIITSLEDDTWVVKGPLS